MFFCKGHVFTSPDRKGGYVLKRDVRPLDVIEVGDLEPTGNAPKPVRGEVIPEWLAEIIVDG